MKRGIQIQAKNDTVNIYLYGYINSWEVSGKKLVDQLSQYEDKYKKLNIYINSNGGDVAEGIALFNILSRTSLELSIYVDGVAASMAAVLVQVPNAKRYMSKHAKLMLHTVSGGCWGSAEELRNTADMMDDFAESLSEMVASRIGITTKKVKQKFFNGKDNWYNAEQALKDKLIDGIVDGKVKEAPQDVNSLPDVIDFYDKQIVNHNQKSETMDLTQFINALSMSAGSTEEQILAGIKAQVKKVTDLTKEVEDLKKEKTTLEDKVKQADDDNITNMVDAAVTAKKITEDQKETYVALAKADFANAKKVLDGMKGYNSIGAQIDPEDNAVVNLSDEEKKYTFNQFLDKAPGKLQAIKEKDPEMYKKLYKDEFGKDVPKD